MLSRHVLLVPILAVLLLFVSPFTIDAQDAATPQSAPTTTIDPGPRGILEQCVLPSVKIEAVKDMNGFAIRGSGSGTLLNGRYILTANHVIEGATEISALILPDETRVPCEVICHGDMGNADFAILEMDLTPPEAEGALLPSRDVAEIELEHFAEVITPEDFANLATGEELFSAGYPLGGEIHLTRGMLCAKVDGFYTTSCPVIYGNSGGGIYNANHKLVGVLVRIAVSRGVPITHISFMVPISTVWEAVEAEGCSFVWTGEAPPEETTPEPEEPEDESDEDSSAEDHTLNIGPYESILIADLRGMIRED